MVKYNVEVISDHVSTLGEGPYWDVETQTLYYVDIMKGDVIHFNPTTGEEQVIGLGEKNSSHIVIPIKDNKNEFIITRMDKLYKLNWSTKQTELLAEVDNSGVETRFNDGKCDSSGRLWVGTLNPAVFTQTKTGPTIEDKPVGALYSYDSVSKLVKRFDHVHLSNGIAWSLDNKHLYYNDTVKGVIYSFDFDIKTGNIENNKILIDFKTTSDESIRDQRPDGMTIDRSGNLWVALFGGGKIAQISTKTGRLIDSVELPASNITSACFGGQDLNQLYVTSASISLREVNAEPNPSAGKLFRITSDSQTFGGFEPNYAFSA